MMRIITGSARGTRLQTLTGDSTRPTAERTKEAIFSVLQFELQGKNVLDLFAGSGQMALEALSRGAAHAVLCDASRDACRVMEANATKTRLLPKCELYTLDWSVLLQNLRGRASFGLVFLDPPYSMGAVPSALKKLLENRLLEENAKIVCETADEQDVFAGDELLRSHFEILRTARYGAAFVTILTWNGKGESV